MTSVLYDAPGPRARRRAMVGGAVAALVLLGLLAVALLRLGRQGQLSAEKWGPLVNPQSAVFTQVWRLLGDGLQLTVKSALIATVLSLVIGTVLAAVRLSLGRWGRLPVVGLIELLRGLPVVISIYFASRVLPELSVRLDTLWYLVIGLTAYNCVIIAEIVRSGVASLPRGQNEAALAIGLTRGQALRIVLLPQAFRVMLPALISQLVVIVKDTSLAALILGSFPEVMNQAKTIQLNLHNPIQTYAVVAVIFIVVNYGLSRLAVLIEGRLSRAGRTAASPIGGLEPGHGAAAAATGE